MVVTAVPAPHAQQFGTMSQEKHWPLVLTLPVRVCVRASEYVEPPETMMSPDVKPVSMDWPDADLASACPGADVAEMVASDEYGVPALIDPMTVA